MAKYDLEDQEEYLLANNLLDAKDYEELEQLERVAFYIAQAQLEDKSNHDFLTPLTSQSFVELHRLLFKDIFRFAGEIRNVSLIKERTRFCEPQFIENQLKAAGLIPVTFMTLLIIIIFVFLMLMLLLKN